MRILALYGSNYGQAEAVLTTVARVLRGAGHEVTMIRGDASPGSLDLDRYGAVVIAASVIRGRHQRYIRDFVAGHRAVLDSRFGAFISVSGAAPEGDPAWRKGARQYLDAFLAETGWRPQATRIVAGALRYPRYNVLLRWIMKRISAQHGGPVDTSREFEFTDWAGLEAFARELAVTLRE